MPKHALGSLSSTVPDWSGEFWIDDQGFGYMSVHCADERHHRPPEVGWSLVRIYKDVEEDCECYVYRKTTAVFAPTHCCDRCEF